MFTQNDFEQLVKNYNEDYRYLLIRASQKSYDCLISSFMMLKDLYNAIGKFQASGNFIVRILPYPISIRANDDLFQSMGFYKEEIGNIYGFLEFVRRTQGKEFEECLEDNIYNLCKRAPGDQPWRMKSSVP